MSKLEKEIKKIMEYYTKKTALSKKSRELWIKNDIKLLKAGKRKELERFILK